MSEPTNSELAKRMSNAAECLDAGVPPDDNELISMLEDAAQRLRQAEADAEDAARLDWIIDHCQIVGGGNGFRLDVCIPHDSEDVRTAIDAARKEQT